MRKQAVESAKLGHESFTRVWMVVHLVNLSGKDLVANGNPGLSPPQSPPDQLIWSKWLGDL